MTPQRRIDEWRYYVEHFRNRRDNCTSTPDGERLRAIYDTALIAAEVALTEVEAEADEP